MSKASPRQMKAVAIQFMERMHFPFSVIASFNKLDVISLFGSSASLDGVAPIHTGSELYRRIQKLEKHDHVKVFAVSRDFLEDFGEFYSFLCVSPYEEDWEHQFGYVGNCTYRCYAYVWNVNVDEFIEFGSVFIRSDAGQLQRVG